MSGSESVKPSSTFGRVTVYQTAWAIAGLGITAAIVAYFHNRTWWPPDDGVYGYVAQRILAGDILNGNLQDIHAGYVNFLHAAALWLFGEDLVVLRYPLAALTILQSWFAFRLLLPRGPAYAALGAVALGALSFVLFVNPSANWYALFAAIAAIAAIMLPAATPAGDARRDIAMGALLIIAFLLRQLSGVFLAIGVLTWLLIEPRPAMSGRPLMARALAAIMGLGIAAYLWSKGSADGTLLFGLWPLAFLGIVAMQTRLTDRAAIALIGRLAIGGALVALPLIAYHLAHGSFRGWIDDTFIAAFQLTKLGFMERVRYWHIAAAALFQLGHEPSLTVLANGLFWLLLLIAPFILGLCVIAESWHGRALHPLPVIAMFYAPCSAHFEIPIYLAFTAGLTIIALMWLSGARARLASSTIVLFLVLVSLIFQAGQTTTRGFLQMVTGGTVPLDAPEGLPSASIIMERRDQEAYRRLLALIEANAKPGEPILAIPFDPELYFLSRRRSLFDFYITALAIRDQAALDQALQRLNAAPPPIIINRQGDKYSNWASDALMAEVKRRYRLAEQFGSFDVYLRQ